MYGGADHPGAGDVCGHRALSLAPLRGASADSGSTRVRPPGRIWPPRMNAPRQTGGCSCVLTHACARLVALPVWQGRLRYAVLVLAPRAVIAAATGLHNTLDEVTVPAIDQKLILKVALTSFAIHVV